MVQSFFDYVSTILQHRILSSHRLLKNIAERIGVFPMLHWTKNELELIIGIYMNIYIRYNEIDINVDHFLFRELLFLYSKRSNREYNSMTKRMLRDGFVLPPVNIEVREENRKQHVIRQIADIKVILSGIDVPAVPAVSHTKTPTYFPLPKHISDVIFDSKSSVECTVCYEVLTKETYSLSKCGHDYCSTCFLKLSHKPLCAICRQNL